MKHITLVLLCLMGSIAILVVSCGATPPYVVLSQADLIKTPSFQATLQRREDGNLVKGGNLLDGNWVAAYFSTATGNRMCLGGPSASAEMIAFIRSLKKGQTCKLPDDFVAFQKAQGGNKQ